ncbi:MAG: hypothetical protein LUD72_01495 [Bacteroidales bacterium]|nr:hypothetical protein [Bacteroidales bacterium]
MSEDKGYDKYINDLIKEAAKDGIEYQECEENLDFGGVVPDGYDNLETLKNYKVSTKKELYKLADDHHFTWEHVRQLDEVVQRLDQKKRRTEHGKGLLAQYVELVRKLREKGIDPRELDELI